MGDLQPPEAADVEAPLRITTSLRPTTSAGLRAVEQWIQTEWGLTYDRPELLRLITQVIIQLIQGGHVQRRRRHFELMGAPESLPAPVPTSRSRAEGVWVTGITARGMHWIQAWMQQAGENPASWSEVLEVAIDLSLQALQAGWVVRPIGPHVVVVPPKESSDRRE